MCACYGNVAKRFNARVRTRIRAHASEWRTGGKVRLLRRARDPRSGSARGLLSLSSLIIHLILFGRSTRFRRALFGIRFAFKRISRGIVALRRSARARAPKEKISLVTVSCLPCALLHK